MSSGKILVAQGGGPTAVINQSLVGVVLEARRHGAASVYGARHGVRGIVNEDLVDLTRETSHNLELVAGTPASALGSTRDKPDLAYCQEIFKVLKAHQIEHFFNIGGNDSSDTCRIVHEIANFFAIQGINIEAMETSTYAAPHTGSPMFALSMTVNIPARVHVASLRENFMLFCDDRNLDAIIEPFKN